MTDIRKQLGLGFKRKASPPEKRATPAEGFLQDALLAFGPKVMHVMVQAPDRTATVFQLVDSLGESCRRCTRCSVRCAIRDTWISSTRIAKAIMSFN